MDEHFTKNKIFYGSVIIFLLLLALRLAFLVTPGEENNNALVWGTLYQIMALYGAFCGLYLSKVWGGYGSLVGKATLAFALGLFAQSFGQSVASYHFFTGGEVMYPPIGDLGFFGSVLLYIYGVILLAKAAGVKATSGSIGSKMEALLIIPIIILIASYWIFLRGYEVDWVQPIKTLLDFGYPLGQAFYVAVAILTLVASRKFLGGIMKAPVIFFIVALLVQYLSDFTFLYQSNNGTYVVGGIVDFMYFISYFAMTLSLIRLGSAYYRLQNT